MSGPDQIRGRHPRHDHRTDRLRAIFRADAGGHAALGLDRHGVRGLELRGVVLNHRRQVEVIGECIRHRQAHDAAGVADREGHPLLGDVLGSDDDVALVLTVLVVDDDDRPAGAQLGEQHFDRTQPLRADVSVHHSRHSPSKYGSSAAMSTTRSNSR